MFKSAVALALLLAASGCARLSPAGFWTEYRPDLIERKYSDQGPWGGVRWVQWASTVPEAFRPADVLQFAVSKGWTCREPVRYSADQLRVWQFAGQPVFPLHFGPVDRPPDNSAVQKFPRHIATDSVIIECRTGWTRVEPGTGEDTDAFGYIHIEASGSRMAVYHLWGEV